jgi:hypothetical protein
MLKQAAYDWTIEALMDHIKTGSQTLLEPGGYQPSRSFGVFGLRSRLRLAWMVFTGEADALRWPFQNRRPY